MPNPGDDTPILFSPDTFARHETAVNYVMGDTRTRQPRRGLGRSSSSAPGAWGKLAAGATVTGAVGLAIGNGQLKLCDRDGNLLLSYGETEGVSVDVVNAGSPIDGGGSGKIIKLVWILGEWACCGCGTVVVPSCLTACGCFNVGARIQINDSTLGITNDLNYSTSAGSNPWGRAKSWGGVAPFLTSRYGGCEPKMVPVYYNLDATTCKLSIGWYADVGGTECPIDDTSNPANFVYVNAPDPYLNTCDPFERYVDYFDWTAGPTTNYAAWGNLYSGSQTSLTVTSPYSTSNCCVSFPIKGCNNLPLPGALVSAYTNSGKGTLIGTGTTNSTGLVIIDVHGHGSIYYEASADRFATGGRTVNVTACGVSVGNLTLLPASGYHCMFGGCVFPWKDQLHATDRLGNATTINYDATSPAGWKGTSPTFNYPGFGGCSAVPNFSYDILFGPDFQLRWGRAGLTGPLASCPGTAVAADYEGTSNNNFICPPTGAMYYHIANPADTATNNLFGSTIGEHDFTITE